MTTSIERVSIKDRLVSAASSLAGATTVPTIFASLAKKSYEKFNLMRPDQALDAHTRVTPEVLEQIQKAEQLFDFQNTLNTLNLSVEQLLQHPIAHTTQILGTAILVADALVGARTNSPDTRGKQMVQSAGRFAAAITFNLAPALVTHIPVAVSNLLEGQKVASSILELGVVVAGGIFVVKALANIRSAYLESVTHNQKIKIRKSDLLTVNEIPKEIKKLPLGVLAEMEKGRNAHLVKISNTIAVTETNIKRNNRTTKELRKIHQTPVEPLPNTESNIAKAINTLSAERLEDLLKVAGKENHDNFPSFLRK